jgi:thiamine biosynthesis lipoprotein
MDRPLRLAVAAMGTRFELVLLAGEGDLRAAGEAAIEEIETWHRRLTRFAPDSLVSHINREASRAPVRLDRDTFELLRDAVTVWEKSEGAFDVTVASGIIDAGALRLDPINWTIEFARPGVSIDLGGIAKGHAIDCAARILREAGVTSALLHGGTSSILAIGAPGTRHGWRVAVRGVREDRPIELRDTAMSVSDAGGPADARRSASHIVDPRKGAPVSPLIHATVIGPSARLADAWSTALVVLGRVPAGFPSDFSAFIDVYDTALV